MPGTEKVTHYPYLVEKQRPSWVKKKKGPRLQINRFFRKGAPYRTMMVNQKAVWSK